MILVTKKFLAACVLIFVLTFFLSQVFRGDLLLPQSFSLGFLTVRYYGIFIALALACGFYLAMARAKKFEIEKKQAEDILFWVIVGGFIGARFYHVFSSWHFYFEKPLEILKVWNGGLSIYGVILGGLITLWLYRNFITYNLQLTTVLNWLTPSLIVGQIIGRFGNFFNYELYGYPTDLPWKMFVPEQYRNFEYATFSYFHPLFLYEQVGLIIIFIFVANLEKKAKNAKMKYQSTTMWMFGTNLFFSYVLLYNILRFGLEFLRVDSVYWQGFRFNAAVSFLLILFAARFLYGVKLKKSMDP